MTDTAFEGRLAHELISHADRRLILDDPRAIAARAIDAPRRRSPWRLPVTLGRGLVPAMIAVAILTGATVVGGRLLDQRSGPNGALSPLPSPTESGTSSLELTYWSLTGLAPEDEPIASVTDSPMWLRIEDGVAYGESGCGNWYEGPAAVFGAAVDFGEESSLGVPCGGGGDFPSGFDPQMLDYGRGLARVRHWSIEEHTLTLTDEADMPVLSFVATELPRRDLTGRWMLTLTDVPDGGDFTPVPIDFTASTVSVDVGCRPIEGSYGQDGPLLGLGLLSLTDWGCTGDDPQAREMLRGILQSAYSVGITGHGYSLRDRDGTPVLELSPMVVSPPVLRPSGAPALGDSAAACGPLRYWRITLTEGASPVSAPTVTCWGDETPEAVPVDGLEDVHPARIQRIDMSSDQAATIWFYGGVPACFALDSASVVTGLDGADMAVTVWVGRIPGDRACRLPAVLYRVTVPITTYVPGGTEVSPAP